VLAENAHPVATPHPTLSPPPAAVGKAAVLVILPSLCYNLVMRMSAKKAGEMDICQGVRERIPLVAAGVDLP
jgi:hypothetical protein